MCFVLGGQGGRCGSKVEALQKALETSWFLKQMLCLKQRPLFPNRNYEVKWSTLYPKKKNQWIRRFCRKKPTAVQWNSSITKSRFLRWYSDLIVKQKHRHNLRIHAEAQHALLCLQSLSLWIDPCIHTPNIFSFLFSFGEQTWFPSSFEFIRVQPMEYTYMYFFLVRGSFMATKTEPVVSTVQVWCKRLWNLLCNLASRRFIIIFCFPPFWAF